ncbi:phytanoyl-CoA dioxygenase family protein [Novosphingobium sp. BW1]|uniref:phytanoyl-CoA dioxygenase family protein n=1 Tax=Novosphingobium sp. BW1 TaxID=2592621 RepID=UPI0011DEC43B|nr:phytanoyl-CoA dioxygenase family protein [Novosphingobium sp. BW1]TYC91687.1 phytanoyl-CoA dioxygenase family protein [Novosphingobium sp. BW1]
MNDTPLPGIPLIESPLFAQEVEGLGLTAGERRIAEDLHTRGFAVLDFPDTEIDARIARIQADLGPRYAGMELSDPDSDKTQGERRIQDAWTFHDDVRAIAANPAILDLLGTLYGRPAFPFQTLNFPVGTQQGAHSDAVHFSSLPERFMCGVWLAMEDITPENGPVFYLPGSHRWPIMTNAMIARRGFGTIPESAQAPYERAWDALAKADGLRPEPFLARKGQALIWSANLLHGGSLQTDPRRTRWSQVTHYYFEDCIYYTPAYSDEAVGRLHLREPVGIHDGVIRTSTYLGEMVKMPRRRKGLRRLIGKLGQALAS